MELPLSYLCLCINKGSYILEVGLDVDCPDEILDFKTEETCVVAQVRSEVSVRL